MSQNHPNLEALPQARVIGGLDETLLEGFQRREFDADYLLATPQAFKDQVFIVDRGRLRVYLMGENRTLTLSFLEPGDIFTTHTPTYVETVAPSALWMMETAAFARKLRNHPEASPAIMRVLGRLLNTAVELVEDLAFREVPARFARFLLGLVERRGERLDQGWLVPLELTTEEMASLLGSTRQTLSTLINKWQREGILSRQGRHHLLVKQLEPLQALSEQNSA
jgi:CRP-like cAMP-binding protein